VFSRFTRFAMGDGSKIRFWHDVWHLYLELFRIACLKDAYVANHL
jgi:hypothetical protein